MMHRSAILSDCGKYRYRLSRWWGDGPRVVWLMMNPSTADAEEDDQTIRKVTGFTARWGFNGFDVINLFAYRSTDPRALLTCPDPEGEMNWYHASEALSGAVVLICAWGCEAVYAKMQGWAPAIFVRDLHQHRTRVPIECLGKSPSGNPYHPLMLPYSTARIPFEVK